VGLGAAAPTEEIPMGIRIPRFAAAAVVLAAAFAAGAPALRAADTAEVDVPFTRYVLPNGLRLIVHEDHKAPIVGVNVWYHVGSKNERPGRTGFAHLFEHLMFNGSEHYNDDWFKQTARLGATGLNGTTNNDRTNYFQTVPKGALDAMLWLESDRMGHLVGAIDEAKLTEQRGVVQNEKRQGENEPYGRVWDFLPKVTYPAGHPYSWSVIGSMADLDAASLDDVREWFKTYYGAANAVVVVAGDVVPAEVKAKVEKYFGDIPSGPIVTRAMEWIAKRTGSARHVMEERVPQGRIQKVWNVPGWGRTDTQLLMLAANVLSRGEGSRLHRRLVREEKIATDVAAIMDDSEIGGQFHVWATAAMGGDLARVEKVMDEEMAKFLADGPTAAELEAEKVQVRSKFVRGLERVGGFGGKSDLLAMSEVFGGSPDAWKKSFADIAAATPEAVRDAAVRWLSDGVVAVEFRPFSAGEAAKEGADRSAIPAAEPAADARFAEFERAALPNGLRIVLSRRSSLPVVRLALQVDAGFSCDPAGRGGLARLVANTLLEGTATRSSLEIRGEIDRVGAEIEVVPDMERTLVTLETLKERLEPSVALLADVVLRPAFPAEGTEIQKSRQVSDIQQESVDARGMAMRVLNRFLYGEGHPFSIPSSGTGTAEAVMKATRDDLAAFHRSWYRPGNATLVVVGDASMDSLMPILVKHFGSWSKGDAPAHALPAPAAAGKARVVLMDRPGAPQTMILAAQLVAARGGPEEFPLALLNHVFGGMFTSRLNMNLREDKHWSYGAGSRIRDTRGPRVFVGASSVQTDKTVESLAEVMKEFRGIAGERPATEAEIAAAKDNLTLTLPGRWETGKAVAESIAEVLTYELPDRYYDGYAERIRAVTAADVAAAGKSIRPDSLVWVVVGDRRKIEEGVRKLGFGEVVVLDAEGKPVE
jgi:zinc protease